MEMEIHVNLIISPTQQIVREALQTSVLFPNTSQYQLTEMYVVAIYEMLEMLVSKAQRSWRHHQQTEEFASFHIRLDQFIKAHKTYQSRWIATKAETSNLLLHLGLKCPFRKHNFICVYFNEYNKYSRYVVLSLLCIGQPFSPGYWGQVYDWIRHCTEVL